MARATIFILMMFVLACGQVRAEQSVQLRVSATIPPRLCAYPDRCDPPPAATETQLVVQNGDIRYIGSPPEVSRKGDLMIVNF